MPPLCRHCWALPGKGSRLERGKYVDTASRHLQPRRQTRPTQGKMDSVNLSWALVPLSMFPCQVCSSSLFSSLGHIPNFLQLPTMFLPHPSPPTSLRKQRPSSMNYLSDLPHLPQIDLPLQLPSPPALLSQGTRCPSR